MATEGIKGLLKRCREASRGSSGTWIALGTVFLVLGISSHATPYLGIGAAFLAIGLGMAARKRRSAL